jgi:hypothetical protein
MQVNLTLQVAVSGLVTMIAVGEAKAGPEAGGEAVGIHDDRGPNLLAVRLLAAGICSPRDTRRNGYPLRWLISTSLREPSKIRATSDRHR